MKKVEGSDLSQVGEAVKKHALWNILCSAKDKFAPKL